MKEREKKKKKEVNLIYLQNGYNDTKQANGAAEDFHNEDLDKEARVLGISQRCSAANDAHTDPTEKVGKAHSQTSPKHGVTWQKKEQNEMRDLKKLKKNKKYFLPTKTKIHKWKVGNAQLQFYAKVVNVSFRPR